MKRILIISSFFFISIASLPQKHLKLPDTSSKDTIKTSVNRTELVSFAENYLGTPYRQSGMNPKKGFDCSGFVNFVFNHFNIKLPRSSKDFKTLGAPLEPADFKIGDVLVFYGFRDKTRIGHVGIICEANGMKSKFIHASSGRAKSVTISDLGSEGYKKRFYKCIDVIGNDDFEIKGKVYAFDSTTIDLCLNIFWWAKFRKAKAGIKLHTLYDVVTQIPTFIHITPATIRVRCSR